jgi:predicted secreted protein
MNWVIGTATYFIIWWLVIFVVLPFGVRPTQADDPGHAAGAPANPRLPLKFAVTTLITTVIWLLVYWAVSVDLVDFRGS